MKVFLNSNFEIENISNESGDPIVRGSDKFNKLHIFIPTSTVNSYNTISPLYSVKRADGRVLGNYATITTHDNTEAFNGYYGWKGDFNPRDIAVAGALELTISFKMKKTAASVEMTKTVAKITLEVKDAAVVLDDVLVLGDGDVWISLSESIEALQNNLSGKADKINTQQSIVAGLVKSTSFKKGDDELATETQVSEEATARQQADNALQTDINTRVKIADIINALNDTSTNKPLSAYQGKLLKDAIDSINTLLQSNDTDLDELQEIVTYIKNNKSLIDGITSSKISFSDIVDNLTSELANKPLSAKQGKVLKGLIDALQTAVNNRYTKSEADTLLNGKADKSTTYTKTQVNNLLDNKQDITIPAITIAGIEYTNLEAAINAINDYAETIEQVIGSISGNDTTIATRLTQLESSVSSLNSAWTTFTTGTSADDIINTLVEIQNRFKNFNIIRLPDGSTSGYLSNDTVNIITSQTLVVYEGTVFTLSKKGDDYYYFSSNYGDDITSRACYLHIENNPNNDEEQSYHIEFVDGEIASRKVTSWSQNPSNEAYPSEKLVKDSLDSETTRATTQENKSLYHLGAFDSADGKTRQTGYETPQSLVKKTWTLDGAGNTSGYKFWCYIPNAYATQSDRLQLVINNSNVVVRGDIDTAGGIQLAEPSGSYSQTRLFINVSNDVNTVDKLKVWISQNNFTIQYKLATSYQDTPIEGESILPLDTNMTNKIRQDVVDSLQEFDNANAEWKDNYTILSSDGVLHSDYAHFFSTNAYTEVKPNTTYTISCSNYVVAVYTYSTNSSSGYIREISLSNGGGTFTTSSTEKFIRIRLYNASATTHSDLVMLSKSTNTYPPSDYHASKHITDEEATLLKDETVKCRNLWNGNSLTRTSAGTGYYGTLATFFGGFELNKTYTIGFRNSGANALSVELRNGSTLISYIVVNPNEYKGLTFNAVDLSYILNIYFSGATTCDFTIFDGSVLQPYSEYYGELVHKVDLEPALLWENPSPNSAFASQTITVSDMSNYKYIVFEYLIAHTVGDGFAHTFQKFKRSSTVGEKYILSIAYYGQGVAVHCRNIENSSSNADQLYIMDGKYVDSSTNETNNDVCVPIAIYGTNIL